MKEIEREKKERGGKGLRCVNGDDWTGRNRCADLIFRIVRIYNGLYWRENWGGILSRRDIHHGVSTRLSSAAFATGKYWRRGLRATAEIPVALIVARKWINVIKVIKIRVPAVPRSRITTKFPQCGDIDSRDARPVEDDASGNAMDSITSANEFIRTTRRPASPLCRI